MGAALLALTRFRRIAESHGVDEILAAATSATREAENAGEFLARIVEETGIRPRVISGTEEARLIHLAAVYGVDVMHGPAVVIDIGGGSVEITLGDAEATALGRSFKMGVIRLTERFVTSDPLAARDERKMVQFINREIEQHASADRGRGLRPRHRDVGHDPEPRHDGGTRGVRPRARRDPEPAHPGPADPPAAEAGGVARAAAAAEASRPRTEAQRHRRGRARCCSTPFCAGSAPTEITLCDLALREGLILDYISRNRSRSRRPIGTPTCGGAA